MKVLLINGSPHKNGCVFTALSEIKKTLAEDDVDSEIFHIGTEPVRGCIACHACFKNKLGKCAFDDDVCNTLVAKMKEADGIIIGSPVHYASAAGALCTVLDRAFYSAASFFEGKPGAAVVSCRRGGASAAFDRLNKYFTISRMPVVSSQYWNAVHGRKAEEVLKDEEGLQIMRALAHNMAWLLKSLKDNPAPKAEEPHLWTNFIR